MRVPLSWLEDYTDFDLPPEELSDLFSLHSQEVEGIDRFGLVDGEVVVGEVVEFGPHPEADRLNVAKVDLGGREVQIVAGAPNPYPGAKVAVVLPGSKLAGIGEIRKAKLRGLESYGMMMSERELGISDDHEGILLLDGAYEVGRPFADYFPTGEAVLDIDVMPNRPDLWGVIGIARELSAILGTDFRIPQPGFEAGGPSTGEYTLRVEAGELCPRYDLRRVSGLPAGAVSPLTVRQRLYAAGMRPINAVVDATNYVMLETGQPLHAFDAGKVRRGIVVRRAHEGEEITLLDGLRRVLDSEMLLIADEERGLVIAGIMGAEDAEVDDTTEDVLIEAATFDGRNILENSGRLGVRTESSGRFERGLDPEMVGYARDRVCSLLADLGGSVGGDTLSHYPEPAEPARVPLRPERAGLLLGMRVGEDEAAARLSALGCEVGRENGKLSVLVPTFRRDLTREADLVEEVGRLTGLDRVPETLPATSLPGGLSAGQQKERTVRRMLSDLGLHEALTYPFGPLRWWESLGEKGAGVLEMQNPLSSEGRNLRPMLLPSLLDAMVRNSSFGRRGGALFELGNVFGTVQSEDGEEAMRFRMSGERGAGVGEESLMGVRERYMVGAVLAGSVRPKGWNAPELEADFFKAKGLVERLVPGARFRAAGLPFLHPGRAAVVLTRSGEEAGWVGEVHPQTVEGFDLGGWRVAAFELDFSLCDPDRVGRFEPFFNVPAVSRDLAVVLDEGVEAGEVLEAARSAGGRILADARIFDVYRGQQVPEGKKSLALSFTFQGEETLTDEQVDEEMEAITSLLETRFGAQVRGS